VHKSEFWEQHKLVRVMRVRECACQSCPSEHVRVKRVHVKDVKGEIRVANK